MFQSFCAHILLFKLFIVLVNTHKMLTSLNLLGFEDPVDLNYVADMVRKQRKASINEFEISHDSNTRTWHVEGSGLERFVQMTNWR